MASMPMYFPPSPFDLAEALTCAELVATAYDSEFATATNQNGVPTYRVVNTCDLVPEVPAAALGESLFQHIGTPVDFTAQYNSIGGNHSLSGAYSYAINHPDQPQGPLAHELA